MISSHLNGDQLGQGANVLGNILAQQSLNDVVEVNITNDIPHLAVEDCILHIFVSITLVYQPVISIPFSYTPSPIEISYEAPFTP